LQRSFSFFKIISTDFEFTFMLIGNQMGVFKVRGRGGFLRINGVLAGTTLLPYKTGPC
jgi:hypothetical protein